MQSENFMIFFNSSPSYSKFDEVIVMAFQLNYLSKILRLTFASLNTLKLNLSLMSAPNKKETNTIKNETEQQIK